MICSIVTPSIHISLKHNSSQHELIVMILYTVVVFDLRMCMKEDNPGPKNNF